MSNQQIAVTVLVSLIIVGGLSGLIIWNETRPGSDYGIPILEVSNAYEYTLAEVATHNTASSCWAAVNGKVYDLTSWIGSHPGGQQAILSLCGHDASGPFNA